MFRPALRAVRTSSRTISSPHTQHGRRFLSTAPPHKKSRSWKSSIARWGAAGGLVYWYNTAAVFAEEPAYAMLAPLEPSRESETYNTLDAVAEQRRTGARSQFGGQNASRSVSAPDVAAPGSPEGLEEEASQQGAFNEETGEINWDCPCLGGMATGPCGDQFKAAFSCFVFSKEEPKGVDCIEHFKAMQNCFREHPDVYGSELENDEAPPPEGVDGSAPIPSEPSPSPLQRSEKGVGATSAPKLSSTQPVDGSAQSPSNERAQAAVAQVKRDHDVHEADEMVPKAWHDTTQDNRPK